MVEQVVVNNLATATITSFTTLTAYYFEDNAAGIVFGLIIGLAINFFFAQQILAITTALI